MKKTFSKFISTCALAVAFCPMAQAIIIDFSPANQSVYLGDSVSVDIRVSDFAADKSLGDYDFVVDFDSPILDLTSVTFGTSLGFSDNGAINIASGSVNLFELSWESAGFLQSTQADSFTLATLSFGTSSVGISSLEISKIFALGDQYGDKLDATLKFGSIEVLEPKVTAVPEPNGLVLLGLGLAAIGIVRGRAKSLAQAK